MHKRFTFAIVSLSLLSLCLLHTAVDMVIAADSQASIPLILFIIAAPITTFIYFGGKALGQEINLGIIAGNDVRMFVFSAMLFTSFIAPSSIMHNESLWDWGVDILIIILLSILTTRFFIFFIKKLIDDELV